MAAVVSSGPSFSSLEMAAAAAAYDAAHHPPASPTSSASPPGSSSGELFTCSVCQKSFEKRTRPGPSPPHRTCANEATRLGTSRDRHTRRCRKKRPEDIIPRRKSCNHCAASKARCDQRRPQCTRCRSKGLTGCEYAYQAPAPPQQENNIELDAMLLGDVDLNLDGDMFNWNHHEEQQMCIRRPSTVFQTSSSDSLPSLTMSSASDSPGSSRYDFDLVATNFSTPSPAADTALLAPPLPASTYPQVELVSRLLSTFPALLKKPSTAPPFIHRSRLLPGKRSEPLANITALVHLSSVKSADNKTFVAGCIAAEWARLEKAITSGMHTDPWEQLEHYQALVTLALLRLGEGEMEVKDNQTLENCACRIGFHGLFQEDDPHVRGEDHWETWMLLESKRRTMVTYYLIDRVFHYRHGMLPFECDGVGLAQLPACRSVWDAENADEWERESQNVRSFPGWEGRRTDWVNFKDLWEGNTRVAVFYQGMDMLGTALMADAVVHTAESFRPRFGTESCNFK
jgi:hypothetical protein